LQEEFLRTPLDQNEKGLTIEGVRGRFNLFESELRTLFVFVFPRDLSLGIILRGPFGNMHIGMRLRIVNPFCCHNLKYTYNSIKLLVEMNSPYGAGVGIQLRVGYPPISRAVGLAGVRERRGMPQSVVAG
jgi:hypothetical protein